MLNFFLSSSLKDAHSRNLERGRHLQNTFSAHTRNKKMHARQNFFQQASVLSDSRWALLGLNDRRERGAEAWGPSFGGLSLGGTASVLESRVCSALIFSLESCI